MKSNTLDAYDQELLQALLREQSIGCSVAYRKRLEETNRTRTPLAERVLENHLRRESANRKKARSMR